ncbi:hypothetical protein IGI04_011427 [Brassica rapa subsp. trilocularis]|uniref:Uncharacterized protein n=1 Tax=Brassica rapa subsp. trilocularis TaxID=1813537 RepID=A0ABQ7N314_BRACM|nr:hypothetical protein IGI04_011427 [Brassica rapa subsp. trilocularis]
MAVSSFQCPTIFSIPSFQCRSSRRRFNPTAGMPSPFTGGGRMSSMILRFPPNFVRQLSIKARRNCSNIGVAQIVAAKWSNNPDSGSPPAAAAAASSASAAASAPAAAIPPVALNGVDEEVVAAEGIREIGSVQLKDSKPSFLSSDGSLAVHAGERLGRGIVTDAITTPVVNTSAYHFKNTAELLDFKEKRSVSFEYGRYGNPTTIVLEDKISALEGAESTLVMASGMCASTVMLLALVPAGGHIVTTTDCYRKTRIFMETFLPKMGITVTVIDPADIAGLEAAVNKYQVSLFFTESPTNPFLRCVDIELVSEICHKRGTLVCIDGTFATPLNQKALAFGADLVVHSLTKYIGGHNDVLGGCICGPLKVVSEIRNLHHVLGGTLNPNAAYLIIRGMKTMHLRVQQQNSTASRMAEILEAHPKVSHVYYPGLANHPEHHIAKRQMTGFGGVVSFEIDGDIERTIKFVDSLKIPYIAPSFGGCESIVDQPAIMSYWDLAPEERLKYGIKDNLVRFSFGVEDFEDVKADEGGVMILSALLTSVGINLGLCFLFFTLYSILRKQPGNVTVYGPRLIQDGESQQTNAFNLERLLPTAGWVRRALEPTNEDILSNLGLDALVFIRVLVFSIRVFSFASVVGIFILLPVNYMGTEFEEFFDLPKKSLDSFSISNVNDGSNKLWIHFSAIYIFTAVVCYLLYYEHKYLSSKRIDHFYSSKPQPHEFTVLVSGVPVVSGNSISETVESFFREYHSSTYLSHVVVQRTDKLKALMNDAEKLYKKLTRVKSGSISRQKSMRDGFLGMFGKKVDVVDHYEKKLEKLEDDMRLKQSLLAGEEVPAAFVSFRSRHGAAIATNIQQGIDPTQWLTEPAPEPQDVHWPFFTASFVRRWISNVVVFVAFVALIILYVIPVVLVQGLANLHQKVVSQVITGYLPSLIYQLFLMIVPPIMLLLSSMQGYISHSQIEKSACIKLLVFTIWNSFFANVLSGSALYRVNVFLEPKNIPRVLAAAVPAQASFFISYVVTSGWTGLSSEIFRLVPLLWNFVMKLFGKEDDKEFEVPPTPFCQEIPSILFFGLLGTTYFFLSPLILPFLLVYFCLGYVIYRNQLLNVYAAKYETGGKFWPIVHNSTIFSLVLMHVIAIGIFGLKELPLASSLTIPLPILTVLFSIYCQRRFLANFKSYPTECLVNKDKADAREQNMSEFYAKLVVAYRDPAVSASRYARGISLEDPPLLRSNQG